MINHSSTFLCKPVVIKHLAWLNAIHIKSNVPFSPNKRL